MLSLLLTNGYSKWAEHNDSLDIDTVPETDHANGEHA